MRLIKKSRAVNVAEIIVTLIHKDHNCSSKRDTPINWKMYVDDHEFHANLNGTLRKNILGRVQIHSNFEKDFMFLNDPYVRAI
jgi:hypothetical protein